MKLLLTAFDPFGGDKVNPALEAVKLVSEKVGNVEVVKLEVPTVFRKSIATVAAAIAKEKPDAVLCIGQAGGRYDITPERVAINLDDARIKDLSLIHISFCWLRRPTSRASLPLQRMPRKPPVLRPYP